MTLAAGPISALDTDQIKTVSIAGIVVVLVVGVIISWIVTKIVSKIIAVIVAVVVAAVLFQQRSVVVDRANKAAQQCSVSFLGIHIQPTDETIKNACKAAAQHPK